jgi:hypothetical protein
MSHTREQTGLGPLQRLTQAFLVTAQHERFVRWVPIQANDVPELVFGSCDTLNIRVRWGLISLALHSRCTVAFETSVHLYAGDLARPDSDWDFEQTVLTAIGSQPSGFGCQWDGAFAALGFDAQSKKAAVVTDRFGLFPVYCIEQNGTYCYSTSLQILTALMRPTCHLDMTSVHEMLVLGMILGNRTFLREVGLVCRPQPGFCAPEISLTRTGEEA